MPENAENLWWYKLVMVYSIIIIIDMVDDIMLRLIFQFIFDVFWLYNTIAGKDQ